MVIFSFLIIDNGKINVTGKGFAEDSGPGKGYDGEGIGAGGGAGYGGKGGNSSTSGRLGGPSYGSITIPINLGSGGGGSHSVANSGGSGGGALFINVTGVLNISGNIINNGVKGGGDATYGGGGGSGGSIYIIANTFAGNGSINASGGAGYDATVDGGGGAGGRIAVYYTAITFNGTISALCWDGPGTATDGGAGTNFSASNITTLLTLNQTTNVVPGQNLTIYGNLSVSAYNLTNYTFSVYIDSVQYFINDSEQVLKNATTSSTPKTNYTSSNANTGDFRYNLTIPDSFANDGANHTLSVNATLALIKGGAIISFQMVDLTPPVVNATLNKSLTTIYYGDVINITANITDKVGLSFCQIIINQSGPTALHIINISLSGTSAQCSNKSEVALIRGNVINYTIRVNDTSNNFRTNDTIITVANTPPSGLSILFPTNNLYTSAQPLDLNVTFAKDPDGDKIGR